jgi:hypothetical protein
MRWERAKAILIVAFLCLDLFLWGRIRAEGTLPAPRLTSAARVAGEAPPSAVTYGGVLPAAPAALPPLLVRLDSGDPAALAQRLFGPGVAAEQQGGIVTYAGPGGLLRLAEGVLVYQRAPVAGTAPPPGAAQARAEADDFLARLGGPPADAAFDGASYQAAERSYVVDYVQRYQGQPLFPGRWRVRVDGHGVAEATRTWLAVIGPAGPPRAILSPTEALQRLGDLLGARPDRPLRVENLQLGYFSAQLQAAAWPTVPVWRLRLSDGSSYYVNAYTGTLEAGPQ